MRIWNAWKPKLEPWTTHMRFIVHRSYVAATHGVLCRP